MAETPKKDVILTAGEKVGGGLLIAAGVGAAGYGLYHALPFLNNIVWNTTKLLVGAAVVGGIVVVASDRDVHAIVGRAYRLGIRKLRRGLMTWDPIGNLELTIQHMEKREREMGANRQQLQAQITRLKTQIGRMRDQMEDHLGIVQSELAAGEKVNVTNPTEDDDDNAATRSANAFGRREKSVERLTKLLNTLEATAKTLKRIHNGVKFLIEDTKDEVDVARTELLASTAAGAAADNAMDVIKGDARLMQMYRESMQVIDDKVAERMGAVEMAVQDSKAFLGTVDVKNKGYNQAALKALQRWEKNAAALDLNPGQSKVRVESDAEETEAPAQQASAQRKSTVSNMFD